MSVEALSRRYYSDPKYNGTQRFYDWVRQSANRQTRLLNLGAGPATHSPVRTFRGEVAEVVGADVDACVLQNGELDRAVMIENGRIPLADGGMDLALSDYVLEHVEKPQQFLDEVFRVLRPGGEFFFRTPNIYHYVALISAMTPHWLHASLANRVRGNAKDAQEPWPTHYRLNSRASLTAAARVAGFSRVELRMVEADPSYLRFSSAAFLLGVGYERMVNSSDVFAGMRANIFGRLVK